MASRLLEPQNQARAVDFRKGGMIFEKGGMLEEVEENTLGPRKSAYIERKNEWKLGNNWREAPKICDFWCFSGEISTT